MEEEVADSSWKYQAEDESIWVEAASWLESKKHKRILPPKCWKGQQRLQRVGLTEGGFHLLH